MILVTGATGHVGAEVVARLVALGRPVRAMTRRPAAASVPAEVEVVAGDCDEPASLAKAFEGVEQAFLMTAQPTGSPNLHTVVQVAAAKAAGVKHLVKLSVADGGRHGHELVAAWHQQDEAAVTESGIAHTMLRPGRFMSNTLAWKHMLRRGDTVQVPFSTRRTSAIAPEDIAAVAVAAFTDPPSTSRTLELSGPEALTPEQELAIVGEILGRRLTLVEPTTEQTIDGMARGGMDRELAAKMIEHVLAGDYGADISPVVEQVLGRKPTTFRDWAEKHFKEES
ncbi:NmrA family NAD(P)-binding protein [Kutzneria sp. CA-103260]|uniref:NmrA family NAD(P)-binding protein n=1 Tax=Kutzneria sp. CA-103260 TaxID=2802641 RepID=UPI001BA58A8F|nr:NmrA family NAD(P)-binding protein [Kutzneria sp. CA-103260]